ncbi:MAG TPA: GYD domain-containing protein [Nitrososphaeraceae archaeon]|nr:GYD domain-containing protein [Nitrososphaeraceae archaeon]
MHFLSKFNVFLYILWSYTDQGIKNIKDSPKRVNIIKSKLENAGGKLIETYYTFGKYDGISIVEAPNDEALMSCLLSIGSQGNAHTVTLKAFTYEDASKIRGIYNNNTPKL